MSAGGIAVGIHPQLLAQTVSSSPPFVGPLDDMTANLAVAYSLRRLLSSYEGPAIRARNDSDTEADIGFESDGTLDTTALTNLAGPEGNAYVVTWYDQSGNAQDGAQSDTSKQPRIVDTGVVDPLGIRYVKTGSNSIVVPDSDTVSLGSDTPFTHLSWSRYLNAVDRVWLVSKGTGGGSQTEEYTLDVQDDVFALFVGNGTTGTNAETVTARSADHWYYVACQHSASGDQISVNYDDGTPATAAWSGGTFNNSSDLVLGAYSGGAFFLDGYFNEFILWKRVLSGANLTSLYGLGPPVP